MTLPNKITIECKVCGKKFEGHPSQNRKYCCRKCCALDKTKTQKVEKRCFICGTPFLCYPSNSMNYCSKDCLMIKRLP